MSQPIIYHNGAYNVYDEVTDLPVFKRGLNEDELRIYIEHEYGMQGLNALPERLKRARQYGTSSVTCKTLADQICTNRVGGSETGMPEAEFIREFLTPLKEDKVEVDEPDPELPKPGKALASKIWTIQLGKWRLAAARDIPLLNITAGSGVQAFAPDMELVMAYKRGLMDEADYTEAYRDRMAQSRLLFPTTWEAMLKDKPRLAVACYCRAGAFCHRHIFVKLLAAYLQEQGKEMSYEGELT